MYLPFPICSYSFMFYVSGYHANTPCPHHPYHKHLLTPLNHHILQTLHHYTHLYGYSLANLLPSLTHIIISVTPLTITKPYRPLNHPPPLNPTFQYPFLLCPYSIPSSLFTCPTFQTPSIHAPTSHHYPALILIQYYNYLLSTNT